MSRKKSTKVQLGNRLAEVRKLQKEGKTNREISEIMKIPLRTIEYYVNKIYQEDKELWKNQANESLEGKAYEIKRHYQQLADICEEIMKDPHRSPKDRVDCGKTMIACHNNIYNMLKSGPLKFNVLVNGKQLEDKEKEKESAE